MNEKEVKKTAGSAFRSGRLNGTWKREDLAAILRELGRAFSWKEKKKRVYIITWLSFFVSGFFLVLSAANLYHGVMKIIFAAALLGTVASVTVLVLSIRKSNRLFINSWENFSLFSRPFLDMLCEDIREGSAVEVDLALNDVQNRKYLKETSEVYAKGKYFDCRDMFTEMPFIIARVTLHDGNKLTLSVMDYCKRSVMTKKSPKGRNRITNRFRLDTRTSVRLRVNPGNYQCKKTASQGKEGDGDRIDLNEAGGAPILTLVSDERISARSVNEVGHRDPKPLYQKIAKLYSHLEQTQGK